MSPRMLSLAAAIEAEADGDAVSLAAIACRMFGEAGQGLAEIGQLRAAIGTASSRPQGQPSPAPAAAWLSDERFGRAQRSSQHALAGR